MNYFEVEFEYPGPFCNFPGPDEESRKAARAWHDAEQKVIRALDSLKVEHLHAYGFPDGSLHRFARTKLNRKDFQNKLNKLLPTKINVNSVWFWNSTDLYNDKTLQEKFDSNGLS